MPPTPADVAAPAAHEVAAADAAACARDRATWGGRNVAITGIGGFIGLRLAERLVAAGADVRGLELSPRAAALAESAGATVVVGDVGDRAAVAAALRGADVVIHTAAVVGEGDASELPRYRSVNVGGTRTVVDACLAGGVGALLHVSSVMVYGFRFPENVTEAGPLAGEGNPYNTTKIESEAIALAAHGRGRMRVVALRLGDVYGPRCPSWVLRPIALMRRGLFALVDGGRGTMNHLHVDNLVDAATRIVAANGYGAPINLTDGARTSFASYFGQLAAAVGLPPPRSLPSALLRPSFAALAAASRSVGLTPPVSPAAVDFVTRAHAYDITRLRALGYAPRIDLARGMAEIRRVLGPR